MRRKKKRTSGMGSEVMPRVCARGQPKEPAACAADWEQETCCCPGAE